MANIINLTQLEIFSANEFYSVDETAIFDYTDSPRPHNLLHLNLNGICTFNINDNVITTHPGEVIFIPRGLTYLSSGQGTPYNHSVSLRFLFRDNSLFEQGNYPAQKIVFNSTDDLLETFRYISHNYYNQDANIQLSVLIKFYQLIHSAEPSFKYKKSPKINPEIKKVMAYIEANYDQPLSIPELAKMSNFSIPHFHALFKQSTGLSPISFKNKIAIEHATSLLLNNKHSIGEISEAVGFSSISHFRSVFKEFTGKTPKDFRKTSP